MGQPALAKTACDKQSSVAKGTDEPNLSLFLRIRVAIGLSAGYCPDDASLIMGGQGGQLRLLFLAKVLSVQARTLSESRYEHFPYLLCFLSNIRLPRPSSRTVAGSGIARYSKVFRLNCGLSAL